jgi:hypothetical protein
MWRVELKGDPKDISRHFELSVTTYPPGGSWGWGGPDKIILFSSGLGGNQLNPCDQKAVDFALKAAELFRDALNQYEAHP